MMNNNDIYLVHKFRSDSKIAIKERDKLDSDDIVLRRLNLYPANLNDLIENNILMDKEDFFYELHPTENEEYYDEDHKYRVFELVLVGDVLLDRKYQNQAECILKIIKEKEMQNDSKIDQ